MNKTLTIVAVLATTFFYAQNQAQAIDTVQIQGRTKVKKERSEFKNTHKAPRFFQVTN
jgi:hypothetical protein